MVGEWLCTEHQAQQGLDELHRRMAQYYERIDVGENQGDIQELMKGGNKYDTYDGILGDKTPLKKAKEEWNKWENWCLNAYLPEMKPTRVFNVYDDEGNEKETAYRMGEVVARGRNLKNGKNHADYVVGDGYYDCLR